MNRRHGCRVRRCRPPPTPDQITRCIVARIIDGGNTQVVQKRRMPPMPVSPSACQPDATIGRINRAAADRSRRHIPSKRAIADTRSEITRSTAAKVRDWLAVRSCRFASVPPARAIAPFVHVMRGAELEIQRFAQRRSRSRRRRGLAARAEGGVIARSTAVRSVARVIGPPFTTSKIGASGAGAGSMSCSR